VEADVDHIFAAADRLGRLAGLVNNAGVVDLPRRVEEMDTARLTRMFGINAIGTILCSGRAVRRMSRRHGGQGGAIVNLSSAAARLGGAGTYVDYAAAKGAIDSFTTGLALEVAGEGIRVNAVRPGIIETEMHASGGDPDRAARLAPELPMGRAGTAEEVARAVLWLLSAEASYTTGSVLSVTGGRAIGP
jgi:NAD(P)-dependent dehydrogenase (short-subunit alcohol dehydrogenase family)